LLKANRCCRAIFCDVADSPVYTGDNEGTLGSSQEEVVDLKAGKDVLGQFWSSGQSLILGLGI
jgi:hypothetical protein